MNDALAAAEQRRLPAEPTGIVLDFLPFEERIVRRNGIRLFNVLYFDGTLAPLLVWPDRRCRVKYDPRSMDAVFVELPEDGHLRVPCTGPGRPAISLWEQHTARPALRKEGRRTADEAAVDAAGEEQRRVLAMAHSISKAATRSPALRSIPDISPHSTAGEAESEEAARRTVVVIGDGRKTEFLP